MAKRKSLVREVAEAIAVARGENYWQEDVARAAIRAVRRWERRKK